MRSHKAATRCIEAAVLCGQGCNPTRSRLQPFVSRLQPYILEAATLLRAQARGAGSQSRKAGYGRLWSLGRQSATAAGAAGAPPTDYVPTGDVLTRVPHPPAAWEVQRPTEVRRGT